MPEFVYLLRSSEPRVQSHIEEWLAWIKELDEKGNLKMVGPALGPEGRVVGGEAKAVTDGPYGGGTEMVDGYMVIEAADIGQSAEIAKGCPLLANGGVVEVRPVTKLDF